MTDRRIANEPDDVYFQRDLAVASNSGLKVLAERSPMAYHWYMTHPEDDESSTALDFGHGFHCATLEPEKFARTYCVLPNDAPRRPTQAQWNAKKPSPESQQAMDWWRVWMTDNQGRTVLSANDYDMIQGMAGSARANLLEIPNGKGKVIEIVGGELFDMCEKEVTYYWTDPRTGLQCKSRVDLDCAELEFGGDLKSTIDASPEGFARGITRYRYHQQHAHYCDGRSIVTGKPWKNFLFFACEKAKPHVPGVYQVNAMAEERGFELRNRALDTLKVCIETGKWPPYSNKIVELALPAYAFFDGPQE